MNVIPRHEPADDLPPSSLLLRGWQTHGGSGGCCPGIRDFLQFPSTARELRLLLENAAACKEHGGANENSVWRGFNVPAVARVVDGGGKERNRHII